MKYLFNTYTTLREQDAKRWWIDSDIISTMCIEADNVSEALNIYQKEVADKHYISISNNALKCKEPMYSESEEKQVGYVITAKTELENNKGNYVEKYIDLWVTILTIIDTVF